MVNPFPLSRSRRGGRANAHHNPAEPYRDERSGRYRPAVVQRMPRCIPDKKFDQLFSALPSNRGRALVAFWVSTGARASELLGATTGDTDPGQQLITVIRRGTRFMQLPVSPDAFVWLRLYQAQMQGLVPAGRDQPLWWTLLRPFRRLAYHGAEAMFARANATLGANWTLHDLRHTAAYRMARDPGLPVTDVRAVDPWPRSSVHHPAVSARGRLPRRDHQRAPGVHSPAASAAPIGGVPRPQRRRVGRIPRAPYERRKLALGTCGRSYDTGCIHEHARCPLLRPDPAGRPRLMEIRDNLTARIAEATANGWAGDVDGLTLSRTAAEHQLDQMDQIAAHRGAAVHLGMPAFSDVAGQTVTTPAPRPAHIRP